MNAEPRITRNEARYLKFIYREQCEGRGKLRTTGMARSLGVRPATVTEVIQNIAKKDLLLHRRYCGVELTQEGLDEARRLLRKHRILEFLLAEVLGFDAHEACDEASRLDYHASNDVINAICRTYGHPKICPCNKVIPGDSNCSKKEV